MARNAPLVAAVFVLYFLSIPSVQAKALPIQTTVCEVVTHPEKFEGKRIRVRAEVGSDGIEHTVLVDDKATCKLGLGILLSKQARERRVFDEVSDAIYRQRTIGAGGFGQKRIFAVFVGVFKSQRKMPIRVLSVESVSDLQVDLR